MLAGMMTFAIYESYIGKGAPTNAAGSRRGYGLTPDQAHRDAQHWANQAPWARTRKIIVSDVNKPSSMTSRDEQIAWHVCGFPGEYVPIMQSQRECSRLIREGRYATAIHTVLSGDATRRHGGFGAASSTSLRLYANPYDISARGWYFTSLEDFEQKFKKHLPVEEYEIDFIDGSTEAAALFKILKVNQGNVAEFFERLDDFESMNEHDQAALYYVMEEANITDDLDEALKLVDDEVRVMEGDAKDYAYNYIDSIGEIPKKLADMYFDYESFGGEEMIDDIYGRGNIPTDLAQRYFDYDAFARNLVLSGDIHEFRYNDKRWVTDYN